MQEFQVFFKKCISYDATQEALTALFKSSGFPDSSLKGKNVVIKPNLLSDKEPDRAVTTHPEVVRGVVRALKKCGAVPSVSDSPCSAVKIEKVWDKTGMLALCKEENVELINAEKSGSVTFAFEGTSYSIAKPFMDADAIVNVPKLKTHVLTSMTAGVKNLYGTIPGYQKAQLHKRFPDVQSFSRLLASLHGNCTPVFNILDAITGMQGEGPSAGERYDFGFLAASPSAVALDFALAHLLGIPTRAVPYLPMLSAPASPEQFMDKLIFEGDLDKSDRFEIRTPSTVRARLIPGWLIKLIDPFVWIRPKFMDSCIHCGRCIEACPVKALSFDNDKNVVLSPKVCIGCCCCHEICPVSAVEMTQSPLLNFVRKGRMP
jgi:uncharacterized protein (DUF362 family)/ferredoxin